MIRCTCLAQNVVAHPMVIARALPDSPVPPNIFIFYVCNDTLDGYFSKCCCASDGGSSASHNQMVWSYPTASAELRRRRRTQHGPSARAQPRLFSSSKMWQLGVPGRCLRRRGIATHSWGVPRFVNLRCCAVVRMSKVCCQTIL
jgi:hypothetical protein